MEAERENKNGEENGKGGGDWNRVKNIIQGRSREQKESGEENKNRENAKREREKVNRERNKKRKENLGGQKTKRGE